MGSLLILYPTEARGVDGDACAWKWRIPRGVVVDGQTAGKLSITGSSIYIVTIPSSPGFGVDEGPSIHCVGELTICSNAIDVEPDGQWPDQPHNSDSVRRTEVGGSRIPKKSNPTKFYLGTAG